jgi:hypothetical protein
MDCVGLNKIKINISKVQIYMWIWSNALALYAYLISNSAWTILFYLYKNWDNTFVTVYPNSPSQHPLSDETEPVAALRRHHEFYPSMFGYNYFKQESNSQNTRGLNNNILTIIYILSRLIIHNYHFLLGNTDCDW